MASSILGIGQSALNAAQTGLATTGHNIANVNTPGYSRQVVVQGAAQAQDIGVGFLGKGTGVSAIKRVYNEFLNNQVVSSQVSKSSLDTYYSQIQQIDNMLADPTAGVSAAMQDFFNGVHDVASSPASSASRQAMLSSAEAMAARFQAVGGRLDEMRQGVNDQINTSIGAINGYAQQIATLNDAIEKAQGTAGEGKAANDLLDQRDYVVSQLSQEIKVSVVKQNNSYNVFIGNGQALTVGTDVFKLVPTVSPTDSSRVQVGYVSNGSVSTLSESSLPGGRLGGLLEFRTNSLDAAQNSLGRVAIGLAQTFNAQHQLGQDQNGNVGGAFFNAGAPLVSASGANSGNAVVNAAVTDANQLTTSDYRLQRSGSNYVVTRLSDGNQTTFSSFPKTVDGVTLSSPSGTFGVGDEYLIRPTAAGASDFKVAIKDIAKIAAAAPVRTAAGTTNTGTGTIGAAVVKSSAVLSPVTLTYTASTTSLSGFPAGLPVTVTNSGVSTTYAAGTAVPYTAGATISFGGVDLAISGAPADGATFNVGPPTSTLTYDASAKTLSGFPPLLKVTVTDANGVATTYAPGAAVPYKAGATLSFGGVSFSMDGAPADGDKFTVGPNTGGVGDNRNALLLGQLQTANTLGGGTMSYQNAYTLMVSQVGNKTRELEVNSAAEGKMLAQAVEAQQSESGVNLDEEAANMMRYQQAYQAAAKVMQTAGQLFDLLLTLGQ